jgi:hypothetical protein
MPPLRLRDNGGGRPRGGSNFLMGRANLPEYVETQKGNRNDRPKFGAALSHAKAIGAMVVVVSWIGVSGETLRLRGRKDDEVDNRRGRIRH